MKIAELKTLLVAECEKHNITIDFNAPFEAIELSAPEGSRFDTDLHHLVSCVERSEAGHKGKNRLQLEMALRDAREYGPRLEICPANCVCKE